LFIAVKMAENAIRKEGIMQAIERILESDFETTQEDTIELQKESTIKRWFYPNFTYFLIFSFIGWGWETIITSIDNGAFQKRGFLDLPLLPIYGFAITMIVTLFYHKGYSIPKIFIGSALVTSICEFLTSWSLEQIFHQVWWDYSHMTFQIQGRICLLGAAIFGTASVIIVCTIQPKITGVVNRFLRWNKSRMILNISFMIIIIDTISKSMRLLR